MAGSLLPTVIVEVIATVSGVIISVGVPIIMSKLNKINKLHTTVFGLQEVSTVGGLVDNVETNENDIDSISDQVRDNREALSRLESNQEDIMNSINSMEDKVGK